MVHRERSICQPSYFLDRPCQRMPPKDGQQKSPSSHRKSVSHITPHVPIGSIAPERNPTRTSVHWQPTERKERRWRDDGDYRGGSGVERAQHETEEVEELTPRRLPKTQKPRLRTPRRGKQKHHRPSGRSTASSDQATSTSTDGVSFGTAGIALGSLDDVSKSPFPRPPAKYPSRFLCRRIEACGNENLESGDWLSGGADLFHQDQR
jgi:hypothetical protein